MKLHAIYLKAKEGGFTGYFSEFPEAIAEGETEKEVETNLFEALKLIFEYRREQSIEEVQEGTSSTTEYELEIA